MRNLRIFLFILASLFWLSDCTQKESFTTYKVSRVQNKGSLDCYFTASAAGKTDVFFYADCDKYKVGSIIKVQL